QVSTEVGTTLRAVGVAAGDVVSIVADVDSPDAVAETTENNNKVLADGTYGVDLSADQLTAACAFLDVAFDVTVDYSVGLNTLLEDFTISAYASPDEDQAVSGGDMFLGSVVVNTPAGKTLGAHTVVIPGAVVASAVFPTPNFFVKAVVDDGNAVAESDETNNVDVRANSNSDPAADGDGDGTPDCFDGCASDATKIAPGACGCGVSDVDSDLDAVPDCHDQCPQDVNKIAPGACGCGVSDVDSDLDAVPDCNDGCPNDSAKTNPGLCGCGVADVDTDQDLVPDCNDPDPLDPNNPIAQGPPAQQPVPGTIGLFQPVFPYWTPFPVCGIGLFSGAATMLVPAMLLGIAGMKSRTRRMRRRR
ncbi:MAG: hypothetical protein V3T70_08925, partial [Phycisphaerae bacterium]